MEEPLEDQRRLSQPPVVLHVVYQGREAFLSDWVESVGSDGLFLRTPGTFEIGQRLQTHLGIPGLEKSVIVEGTVASIRAVEDGSPAGIGMRVASTSARRACAEAAIAASVLHGAQGPAPYRMLVVEDSEIMRRMYERSLKKWRILPESLFEVGYVADGQQAQLFLIEQPVQILLLDLYLPVIDGLTILKRLRSSSGTASIPVIAVSAGGSDEERLAQQAGANAFLHKPFDVVALLETVARLLAAAALGASESS